MKKYFLLFAAALVLGVTACENIPGEKPGDEPIVPELSVDVEAIEAGVEGLDAEFNITSNVEWTITTEQDWISVDPEMGEGSSLVIIAVEKNKTYDVREGAITIEAAGEYVGQVAAITIPVVQDEAKAAILDAKSKYEFDANGGSFELTMKANVAYEVALGAEWLSIAEPEATRALKEDVITINVAANEAYEPREAVVTITSELGEDKVKVVQTENHTVIVEAECDEVVPAEGGQVKVAVTQNMKYTVECSVEWITKAKGSRALETDSLTFDVAANAAADVRYGYIIISSEAGVDSVSVAQAGSVNAIINIPNARFKKYLITNFDTDEDEEMSVAELQAVTEMALSSLTPSTCLWSSVGAADLTGIERMINLEKLDITNCSVTSVDLSNCTKLTSLTATDTKLTELDLSNLTELTYLNVGASPLTALDLSNNTKLTELHVSGAKLTELNVSGLTELTVLDCAYNKLTALDVTANTKLVGLYCNGNQLTELNVSTLAGLKRLNCEHNKLTSLNVTANSELTQLNCGRNSLTSISATGLANLANLSAPHNSALTSIELTGLSNLRSLTLAKTGITALSTAACPALVQLNLNESPNLASLDIAASTDLRVLTVDGTALTTLDVSAQPKLGSLLAKDIYNKNVTTTTLASITLPAEQNLNQIPGSYIKFDTTQWLGGYVPEVKKVDLSANGTSNCYIVNEAAVEYKFKATVKGNGATALDGETATIEPASASVLWMVANITDMNPKEDGGGWPDNLGNTKATTHLIAKETVELREDGYIYFQTQEEILNGNVIIAAKDADGNIVWSWHLWILNGYDAAANDHYVTASDLNFHMMDRNIGATASPDRVASPTQDQWTQARGFYYQWGRKDPFMGSCKVVSGYAPKIVMYQVDESGNETEVVGYSQYGSSRLMPGVDVQSIPDWTDTRSSIAYSVANPHHYIKGNGDGSYSWVFANASVQESGRTAEWGKLWGNQEGAGAWDKGGVKTMYDPCPVGYRVPSAGHFRFITSHGDNAGAYYNKMAEWKYNCVEKLFNENGEAINASNNVAPFGLNFYIKGSKAAAEVEEGAQNYGVAPEDKTTAFFPAQGLINWSYSDKTYGTVDVTAHTNQVYDANFYGYSTLFMKATRNGEFFNNTNSASYGEQQAKALPVRCVRENENVAEEGGEDVDFSGSTPATR